MVSIPAKRAFLLTLSHREKARALMAEADQALAGATLDSDRYAALRDFYTRHFQDAESHLARLQDHERRKLASLEHQLRATINEQARLLDRAVEGKVSAEKANALNRQFQGDIANLENAIDATESLLNATHSSELGGFVDLPIEEYDLATNLPISPIERWRARRWAILSAGTFVALLLVFLVLRQTPAGRGVSAAFAEHSPTTIGVTITNTGSQPADLFVPWPEGDVKTQGAAYGLQVHVREQGRDAFSLLPASDECWKSNGLPILGAPITLLPNIPAQVTLDIPRLERLVTRPEAIKITLVSPRGRVLDYREFDVPAPPPAG